MPSRPPVFRPPNQPTPEQNRRQYERTRKARDPWRAWFSTPQWRMKRAAQLELEPWCSRCKAPATVAHHVIAHRGDSALFWTGKLESVCASCHSSIIQSEETRR
jgi:5-methylcytosine-specific restriction enzyme A